MVQIFVLRFFLLEFNVKLRLSGYATTNVDSCQTFRLTSLSDFVGYNPYIATLTTVTAVFIEALDNCLH
jgi:hypothetical protein